MERIGVTSDSPGFTKISDFADDLSDFSTILEEKFCSIDFTFWFCLRALYDDSIESGWKSKATFYKKENALAMDLIIPVSEFIPCKSNLLEKKRVAGKYFFPFFSDVIKKYSKKLPALKFIYNEIIHEMEEFLKIKKWL